MKWDGSLSMSYRSGLGLAPGMHSSKPALATVAMCASREKLNNLKRPLYNIFCLSSFGIALPRVAVHTMNLSPLLGQKIGLFKVDSSPPEIEKMNHHQRQFP